MPASRRLGFTRIESLDQFLANAPNAVTPSRELRHWSPRGQAIIYGYGIYRQRVKDSKGNLIWDELTAAPYSPSNPPPGNTSFYDTWIFIENQPTDGEIYPIANITRALELPIALAGSIITIDPGSLPTAPITITFRKNGVSVGTAAIDILGNVVITWPAAISWAVRDQLSILFPNPADATAGNIAISLVWTVL
jgi:hypothetical protein